MGRLARLSLAIVIAVAAGVSSPEPAANAAPTYTWRQAFPWPANMTSQVVYDARRQRLFMFGSTKLPGLGGTYPAEHWEWNGASGTWAQLTTSGTLPGNGVLMAYDSTRNLTVMVAPKEGFWERSGDGAGTWTLRGGPHPELTYAEAMVYDPDGARFLILARQTISQPPTLIWAWDTATGAVTQLAQTGTPPTPTRTYAAVAYDAGRRRLVVAGGVADAVPPDYALVYLMDTWEWNPATGAWAERSTTAPKPGPRGYAPAAYHAGRGHVFLFGGIDQTFDSSGLTALNDLWEWDGAAGAWIAHPLPAGSPAPDRWPNFTLTYDGSRGRLAIFGGAGNKDPTGVLWQNAMEWDDQAGAWVDRSPPVGREGPAMAYDPARARVVMFGGYGNGVNYLNDLWEWDGAAHTWTRRSPPAPLPEPREYMSMAADEKHGTVLLAGGSGLASFSGTWVLDGARTWTKYTPPESPGGRYTMLVYDPGRELVLGLSGGGPGTVLEWDAASGTWTRRPPSTTPTPSRQSSLMAFDAARGRLVAYGGYMSGVSGYLGDTWEWNPADATWTLRAAAGSTPSDRTYTGMYYDSARARVVMLGGLASAAANTFVDTAWEWDGAAGAWLATPIAAATPSNTRPRVGYWSGTAYDRGRGVAVTFGGKSLDWLKETYELGVTCPAAPASCVAVAPSPDGGVGDGGGVDAADGGATDATGAGGTTGGAGGTTGGAGGAKGRAGGAAGTGGIGGVSGRGGSGVGGRGGTTGSAGATGGTSGSGGAAGSPGGTTGTAGGGGTTGAAGSTGGIAGSAGGRGGAAGATTTAGTTGNPTPSAGCGCGVATSHDAVPMRTPLLVIVGAVLAVRSRRRRRLPSP